MRNTGEGQRDRLVKPCSLVKRGLNHSNLSRHGFLTGQPPVNQRVRNPKGRSEGGAICYAPKETIAAGEVVAQLRALPSYTYIIMCIYIYSYNGM